MRFLLRSCLVLSVFLFAVSTPLSAAERLFVFDDTSTVSIYDGETMALLGTPAIGSGGRHAIGVPDPANPAQFLKFFVVGQDRIYTVAPTAPFTVLRTSPLSVNINPGDRSVQLSADSRWLLVAADDFMFAFDADDPTHPAPIQIEMGGPVTGFGILPDSSSAFASIAGSLNMVEIALNTPTPQRLAGPVNLPSVPLNTTVAPSGAGVFTAQFGTVTAIDPVANAVVDEVAIGGGSPIDMGFDYEAPLDEMFIQTGANVSIVNIENLTFDYFFAPPITIKKVVSPKSDLLYLLSSVTREVYAANRDGSDFDLLRDPISQTPYTNPIVDVELNRSRRSLFLAFTTPAVIARLDADASELLGEINLPNAPTGIAVVGTPGLVTAQLQVFGGNGQTGAVEEPLARPLAVRAVDANGNGVMGERVTFRSFVGDVLFQPETAVTNAYGVATTRMTLPTSEIFEVEGRSTNDRTVRFRLNTGVQGGRGLDVLAGDHQITLENSSFPRPTVIRSLTGGQPVVNTELTITPLHDSVSCPENVTTDSNGIASFICTAGDAETAPLRTVRVTVEDELGRDLEEPLTFIISVDEDHLPRDPIVSTREELVGQAGEIMEDAIAMRLLQQGTPDASYNVGVEFESTRDDMEFIPPVVPSGVDGRLTVDIRFPCRMGRGEITSIVNSPDEWEEEFDFRTLAGPASAMARIQGNNQSGDAGARLDGPGQALLTRVTDRCGNPVPGVPLTWEVIPEGAVTLDNRFEQTNGEGLASAIAVLGSTPGPAAIRVSAGSSSTTFDIQINVTPTEFRVTGGDAQEVSAGTIAELPLSADLLNELGAGAEDIPVQWSVAQGAATFIGGSTSVTDDTGRASVQVRAGSTLGPLVIEATAAGFTATFNLTVVGRTPVVSSVGFVNGASFVTGMVPGSLVSIFGVGLTEGVDGAIIAGPAPFPTTLRGVKVLVDGVDAPILGLANVNGQEQINIQVPFFANAPSNSTVVTITNNGVSASFTGVRTFVAQPGVFEVTLPGGRFAAALHANGELVTPSNPAIVGETIQLFWTGGGPITPALSTNQPGGVDPLSFTVNPPAITVDGEVQNVAASVYAPGLLTVYQANIVVSASRSGFLPLAITTLGQVSPEVILPVAQ